MYDGYCHFLLEKEKFKANKMFKKSIINAPSFECLEKSAKFDNVLKGRQGTVLVDEQNGLIPIIRTTTQYITPAQKFLPIHYAIMKEIDHEFNNALIEIYNDTYCTMGFHSDQSLDLANDSYICLFSCYEKVPANLRKLVIQNKLTKKHSEVSLEDNSIVLFSVAENQAHLHKIVLEGARSSTRWLGITFRLSKTYVKFSDDAPYLCNRAGFVSCLLTMATDEERKEFYKHKGRENSHNGYTYPKITYTISASDRMLL